MARTDTNGCTLDANELTGRVAAWQAVSSHALSRTVEPEKITSIYPSDPPLLERLRDLIAAEADCCSFLNFTLREDQHHTVVELAFPIEARGLVESVITTPIASP